MNESVTFVGIFGIPNLEAWLPAIARMTQFVEERVPRIVSFHAFVNAEGTQGTSIYVHPDADSLDQHLAAAAQLIEEGTAMVDVINVELLGAPHTATVEMLRAADTPVTVKRHVSGFARV